MRRLLTFSLVGLAAQLVDGSLGMAYGATSATILLSTGLSPVVVSSSVHLAEVGTTFVSGVSHWRLGNVDLPVVRRIAVPGAVGAFVAAVFLTAIDGETITPFIAAILLALGAYVLARFAFGVGARRVRPETLSDRRLGTLGIVAGTVDALGGGGWGPIATPTLLAATSMAPRKVIGSVDTSEFLVSLAASVGFLVGLGHAGVDAIVVAALLMGGVIAAPAAAWLVRFLDPRILGAGVGGLLLTTNTRTLVEVLGISGTGARAAYLVVAAVSAISLAVAVRAIRADRATVAQCGTQASGSAISADTAAGS